MTEQEEFVAACREFQSRCRHYQIVMRHSNGRLRKVKILEASQSLAEDSAYVAFEGLSSPWKIISVAAC